jgi:hypothetical protein
VPGRPIYESDADRSNQAGVVAKLEQAFGLPAITPKSALAPFDAAFRFTHNPCVVEVKVRRNTRARYPTYMLSEAKYNALCAFGDRGINALLAVQWTDQLGVVQLPVEHTVTTGGRYDRGDSRDVERVVLIPTDAFIRVPE